MLHFITGTDGCGKSEYLRKKALELSFKGKGVLFVVPEQYSFLTEKFFYEKKNSSEIEVASFEKLERKIFSSYGGMALPILEGEAKTVLMWKAVKECADILSEGEKIYSYPEALKNLTEFSNTLRSYGSTPHEFLKAAENKGEILKVKARDIAYILDAYESLIDGKYIDACGRLDTAVNIYLKEEEDIFPDTVIFDEFWYLTGEQLNLITAFLGKGKEVYLPIECEEGLSSFAFSLPLKTLRQLKTAAEKSGSEWEIHKVFAENQKHTSNEMKALWKAYRGDKKEDIEENENIVLTQCPDPYREADLAAARINDLIMSGWHYSDFAVVCASEEYKAAVSDAFNKYKIPFFADFRRSLSESSSVGFALSVISAAIKPDADLYISMLKSGLISASEEEISQMEKYAFIWDLGGKEFERDFYLSPFGFSNKRNSEKEEKILTRLNELRRKIVLPVLHFREKCKNASGGNITRALYEALWNEYKIDEKLKAIFLKEEYSTPEGAVLKERAEGVFNAFSSLLNTIYKLLEDTPLSLKAYKEIFSLYSSACKTGVVPQNKDAVPVGEPGRVRADSVRALFLLGAADGVFPALKVGGDLLTRKEKMLLKGDGFDFIKIAEEAYAEELFTVYKTLMLPKEKLFVSFSLSSFSGDAASKSEIFADISAKLTNVRLEKYEELDRTIFLKSIPAAFSEMAESFNSNTPQSEALKTYFANVGRKEHIDRMESSSLTVDGRVKNTERLDALYPDVLKISASKADKFFSCRFSYFCRYTLGIDPWRKAELAPSDSGTLVHHVLETIVPKIVSGEIDDTEKIEPSVEKIMKDYLEDALGGEENKDKRFMRVYRGLKKQILRLLNNLYDELKQSEFVPSDFELDITDENYVTPLEIPLPSGKKLRIEGIVDRVDILEKNGKKYIRVVDYKTGKKNFALSEINDGIGMQMLMYLSVLSSVGKGKYENVLPAGVLYMPAGEADMVTGRHQDLEKVAKEIQKSYKMKGIVLNDREVLTAMEKDLGGRFIPVSLKGGELNSDNLASLEEFGYISKKINEKLVEMAKIMAEGEFLVRPIETVDKHRPCEYCDYRSICGADETTPAKNLMKTDTEEVLKEMRESYGEKLD